MYPVTPTLSVAAVQRKDTLEAVCSGEARPCGADGATTRTVGAGQTKVDEYAPANVGDTFWVQRLNTVSGATGLTATLNDTAPTNHRWNLAEIEILPAS